MPNPVWILYLPSIISSLYYTNTQRTLSGKINSLSPPPRRYRHAQTNKRRRSPFLCPEPNNRIILNYNKWAQSERQTNSSIYRIALIVDFRDYYTPEVDAIWFLRVASHSWRAACYGGAFNQGAAWAALRSNGFSGGFSSAGAAEHIR